MKVAIAHGQQHSIEAIWRGFLSALAYSYAGTSYANPDAVTLIGNGVSSTTHAYDSDGNLIQSILSSAGHSTTTLYSWDYKNELTETDIGNGSATTSTTYGYDYLGNRVFQQTGSTTTLYPFRWLSVASSTGTGAKYATTTEFVFNGDTLVSTIDQQLASGVATGSPATHYIHPDHLGSTNVITNASGTVEETTDYYPYGGTRIDTGSNVVGRKYIGKFLDDSSLIYDSARYYNPSRGQFLTEEPIFQSIGDASE
jgi:RHS repeat-associated protein